MRRFKFEVTIECASDGQADTDRVQQMLSLSCQELIFDDDFVTALGETQSVSVEITPVLDNK